MLVNVFESPGASCPGLSWLLNGRCVVLTNSSTSLLLCFVCHRCSTAVCELSTADGAGPERCCRHYITVYRAHCITFSITEISRTEPLLLRHAACSHVSCCCLLHATLTQHVLGWTLQETAVSVPVAVESREFRWWKRLTSGQSNLTKSASRGTHSPVRGHPRGSKFVPLNSWGRGSY